MLSKKDVSNSRIIDKYKTTHPILVKYNELTELTLLLYNKSFIAPLKNTSLLLGKHRSSFPNFLIQQKTTNIFQCMHHITSSFIIFRNLWDNLIYCFASNSKKYPFNLGKWWQEKNIYKYTSRFKSYNTFEKKKMNLIH